MKAKYGIRAHDGVTNLLEKQLREEWWRPVNKKNKKM